jgi:hypothetical protein
MRHRNILLVPAAFGLALSLAAGIALCLASPAEAAREGKPRKPAAAHSAKHRSAAIATAGRRDQLGVPEGPLYYGGDYLGTDPDPNIRSQILRDHGRYGSD